MSLLTELLINATTGLLWGSVLGAASVGLTLIWGVMKVVNIAHGESILLGSYIVSVLLLFMGIDPLVGLGVAVASGLLLGFAIYWMNLHKIIGHVDVINLRIEMSTLLEMFAVSIILYNLYSFFTRSEPFGIGIWHLGPSSYIHIGYMSVQVNHLTAAFFSLVATLILYQFISRTSTGKAIRAVMQDSQAAALVGIDPVRIKMLTTVISIGFTAYSGFLVILYESAVVPSIAYKYAPLAFTIVVLGGLGSIIGTYIAGIIIGLSYGISKVVFGILVSKNASDPLALSTAFVILVLTLLLKPEGLFARKR